MPPDKLNRRLNLCLVWHQHQPLYRDPAARSPRGSYRLPWVRLHGLRDYFGMAARLWERPGLRCSINLTPILVRQLNDYLSGATDRLWEFSEKSVDGLDPGETLRLLRDAFDADFSHQIGIHPRYAELFERYSLLSQSLADLDLWPEDGVPSRLAAEAMDVPRRDLVDLAFWCNLAWFPVELREGEWVTPRGETLTVAGLAAKGADFDSGDVAELGRAWRRTLAAVIPLHRALAERGQVELTATPFAHPILPILVNSDSALIDRAGSVHPPRFSYPADARGQIELGLDVLREAYGFAPSGWWPAEGAVGRNVVEIFKRAGARWLATDEGVLALVLGREPAPAELAVPWNAGVPVFFRDHPLSDAVGFHYSRLAPREAAGDFLWGLRHRYAGLEGGCATVILDGDNAWGAYPRDGRDFLLALYDELLRAEDIALTTPGAYLTELEGRGVRLPVIEDLPHASWIDEFGSAPGNDLGTWIGEPEENRAWELLSTLRRALDGAGVTAEERPDVFLHVYAAEGSDWFWWYGTDQATAPKAEREFDRLFRAHLAAAYRTAGLPVPEELDRPVILDYLVWTPDRGDAEVSAGTRLFVQLESPGGLEVRWPDGSRTRPDFMPIGGVMGLSTAWRAELGYPPVGEIELVLGDRRSVVRVT
ncbi:MAG TPA: glycoside hydrolase family 57 protein [bacterium]|nr:glycoside hydrolase family 57 protein [bacterium]